MEIINDVMEEHSPYVSAYKQMYRVEQDEEQYSTEQDQQPRMVRLMFKRGPDCRRYNEPTHNEIAAVFVGEDGAPPANRDIVVYPRDRVPQRMPYISSHVDPMFQQYVVDAYVKTEGCRLLFLRNNQRQLRVDLYSGKQRCYCVVLCIIMSMQILLLKSLFAYIGLMDHLHNHSESDAHAGVPVILPSSFSGSPRAMQQNYQDAMAIVAKYGKPDLFVTYTCNPSIRDIVENLRDGERAEHRPDLVARVFHLHLAELLKDIKDHHVLGVPVARVHVIEFQKRGLPHCHMLIVLRGEDKLRTRDNIDRLICAEIPDPEEDLELYNLVKSCMIHGPCGVQNPSCVCMEDGECKKNFPKPFRDETAENVNGYPAYRRRNNGRTVQIGGLVADNSYVVPYNKEHTSTSRHVQQ